MLQNNIVSFSNKRIESGRHTSSFKLQISLQLRLFWSFVILNRCWKIEYEIQEKEELHRIDSGIITKPGCDCKKVLINESFLWTNKKNRNQAIKYAYADFRHSSHTSILLILLQLGFLSFLVWKWKKVKKVQNFVSRQSSYRKEKSSYFPPLSLNFPPSSLTLNRRCSQKMSCAQNFNCVKSPHLDWRWYLCKGLQQCVWKPKISTRERQTTWREDLYNS